MKVTLFLCLHFSTLYHRLTHDLHCLENLNLTVMMMMMMNQVCLREVTVSQVPYLSLEEFPWMMVAMMLLIYSRFGCQRYGIITKLRDAKWHCSCSLFA
jgi:hypothetical protein